MSEDFPATQKRHPRLENFPVDDLSVSEVASVMAEVWRRKPVVKCAADHKHETIYKFLRRGEGWVFAGIYCKAEGHIDV